MPVFSTYSGSGDTTLTNALLAPSSGITIVPGSIALHQSGSGAVEFYDGSLSPLGIGSGLLLTSGTTPGTSNTVGWFGQDNSGTSGFSNGDADINAVVNTVFQTQSYDATTLEFDFTVADPNATSVSFDLVFGSDEFPEWVDQFVDCAVVMVNGVNYALFNHDPNHPLSVVSSNLAAGYFQDNAGNVLPIEYDGVSHVLKIVAPINAGQVNHIKIGIADTGDHIYDSGIFLSNFAAGNIPGSGVVTTPTTCTEGNDDVSGSSQGEYFDLKGGDDNCYAGAGDDIVVAGNGTDSVFGGSGDDQMKGDAGDDSFDGGIGTDTSVYTGSSSNYTIAVTANGFTITDKSGVEGKDTLTNVEQLKFSDGLFAIAPDGSLSPVTDPALPPANTPGSVVISGVGAAGKVLTASVSDPDGASGPVNFQWQVSDDGGSSWSNVGSNSATYTVTPGDEGKNIQVIANYTDGNANAESPVSAAKAIQNVGEGDLLVTLIQLDAPLGASNINPLTTLVKAAMDLGLSPNSATTAIKSVLGIPGSVNLHDYDAYSALLTNPADATALTVEKVGVEVAILTSLTDDDTGTGLALKILEAAAAGNTLNLADANDLAEILGIDISGIANKNDYPEPLREIFDRNENIDQATTLGGIEAEWQDFLSIQDNVNSTTIADLSIHVNQAPEGTPTALLAHGTEDTDYTVSASDLLQGFSDPEGDTLTVTSLSADNGSVTDNLDGTFTITPFENVNGPVELVYTVSDGNGGEAVASQMFILDPVQDAPAGFNAVEGTANDDVIDGTSGNDWIFSDTGADQINGGSGYDILEYKTSASGVTINLATNVNTGGNAEGDSITGIEVISGSDHNDSITGDSGNNKFYANGGNDTVTGGEGNDFIDAGPGNDWINSDLGADQINGGSGYDILEYKTSASGVTINLATNVNTGGNAEGDTITNIEVISGSDHDDSITGDSGDNKFYANGGNDSVFGGGGDDFIDGGPGNDRLSGDSGADTLVGGLGDDIFDYNSLTDSTTTVRDLITNFELGTDQIELIGLGFTGIGAGAASGSTLGYSFDGVNTIITAAGSDFSIALLGDKALSNGDFLFT